MSAVVWQVLPADIVTRTRSRPWLAFGSAMAIEAAFVLAVLAWLAMRPTQVPDKTVPITIEVAAPAITEEPPKPPEPAKAEPLPPLPKPLARAVTPPVPVPQVVPAPTPQPVTQAPSPVQAAATPSNPPVHPPAPAPAPAPTQPPMVDPSPAYNAKIAAAAQAALEVPGTVTALNFKGRARVGFKLRDGVVSGIMIVQTSGLGAMDRAATKAVQTANYPPPPAALQGKEITYEIWVTHTPAN